MAVTPEGSHAAWVRPRPGEAENGWQPQPDRRDLVCSEIAGHRLESALGDTAHAARQHVRE